MNESLKVLLLAMGLLLAACCLWFFFFYRPEISRMKDIEKATQDLVSKLQSFRVDDRQIAALEQRVRTLKTEVESTQRKIINKDALKSAVRQLEQQGRKFGLKFQTIIPDYTSLMEVGRQDESGEDVMQLTVHIKLQGRYRNFGRFLESLGELPFLISLGEISILYNEKVFPQLEVLMDTILYLQEVRPAVATM